MVWQNIYSIINLHPQLTLLFTESIAIRWCKEKVTNQSLSIIMTILYVWTCDIYTFYSCNGSQRWTESSFTNCAHYKVTFLCLLATCNIALWNEPDRHSGYCTKYILHLMQICTSDARKFTISGSWDADRYREVGTVGLSAAPKTSFCKSMVKPLLQQWSFTPFVPWLCSESVA